MKRIRFLMIVFTVLISFSLFTVAGRADFGDYGGDSDYGDSWDSGWDSDDDDWDWGSDDDDDDDLGWFGSSDSGGYSSSSSSSPPIESNETLDMIIGAIIAFGVPGVIIFLIIRKLVNKKKGKKNPVHIAGATPTSAASLKPMVKYNELDPGFSAEALCAQISNRYVQFQNAWEAKDISSLRPYLTDAFYAQMDRQLDNNYRKKGHTNHIENIAVLGVELVGWRQNAGLDEIYARLRTRIVDYVTLDATGTVIHGSKTAEKFMEYEWTLVRTSGVITESGGEVVTHNCPNCGAVLNINQTAKCEYCGSIVTVHAHEWAVSAIKGLSQRTQG